MAKATAKKRKVIVESTVKLSAKHSTTSFFE
jgi:hypothetical protein